MMPKKDALFELRSLRAAKVDEMQEYMKKVRGLRVSIGNLDRVMRELDPEWNPESIRSRRPYLRSEIFVYGEITNFIYDVLRELPAGETTSARAIAEKAMGDKGLDPHLNLELWNKVVEQILHQLAFSCKAAPKRGGCVCSIEHSREACPGSDALRLVRAIDRSHNEREHFARVRSRHARSP
jgi:hypothetical protein